MLTVPPLSVCFGSSMLTYTPSQLISMPGLLAGWIIQLYSIIKSIDYIRMRAKKAMCALAKFTAQGLQDICIISLLVLLYGSLEITFHFLLEVYIVSQPTTGLYCLTSYK